MPATSDFKNDFLDFVLCQRTAVRNITHICLVESGTGALKDCGSATPGAVSSGKTGVVSWAKVLFSTSIAPTASYVSDAVSVRYRSGAEDVELFRTSLPVTVNTSGVSSVDVTWSVELSTTPSSSGVFADHNFARLFERVLRSLRGDTVRGCLARVLYYDYDEYSGVRTDLLITNLSVDRVNRRAYHSPVNFTGSGSLRYYVICTDPTLGSGACVSDGVVDGYSGSPPGVTPSYAISFEVVFTI